MPRAAAPTPQRRFITPTEAAVYVGVDRITVYRWIHDGRLRAFRLGRRLLIQPDDLEAIIKPVPVAGQA